MNWQETTKKFDWLPIGSMWNTELVKDFLNEQAEISFKAGREQGMGDAAVEWSERYVKDMEWQRETARKAGIKEVVEWEQEPCPHTQSASYFRPKCICNICRQAKLKEWGIES